MKGIQTFENAEMRRLSRLYDIEKYREPVTDTMGAHEDEYTAYLFLSFSVAEKRLVGIKKSDLEHLAENEECDVCIDGNNGPPARTVDYLIGSGHAKLEIIDGTEVLFPTEKLLLNQEIPLKR